MIKSILFALLLLSLAGCDSKKPVASEDGTKGEAQNELIKKGDCFDKLISPYIYQVVAVEGERVFYYALGKREKKVEEALSSQLFKGEDPFKKITCP